jgi:hypothetical protein
MTFEPNPINPIGWLVIFLLGLAGLFLFAAVPMSSTTQVLPESPSGRPARPQTVNPPVVETSLMIPENGEPFGVKTVDVLIRESAPPQIVVTVSGYWPNGCTAEPRISTAIDGNHVTITIFRIIPPDVMCTMVMQAAEIPVDISDLLLQDGMVRSGQYTIEVNGVVTGARF